MDDEFVPIRGDVVPADALVIPRCHAVAKYLAAGPPYATLVECRRAGGPPPVEVVVVDLGVEVSQRRGFDVHPTERLALVFDPTDQSPPEALALRRSFPLVPHTNVRNVELPRSLCWSDEAFSTLKLRWTPQRFIGWLREWLAQAADGTLHGADQALEPIFVDYAGILVLEPAALDVTDDATHLFVGLIPSGSKKEFLRSARRPREDPDGANVVLAAFTCDPRAYGVIRKTPATLAELHAVCSEAGLDLLGALRRRLRAWWSHETLQSAYLMVLLTFPKTRQVGAEVEASDWWAFLLGQPVRELGQEIGVSARVHGKRGLLLKDDEEKHGEGVEVRLYNPVSSFSRDLAAACNGVSAERTRVAAVGVGALGSQIVMNLVRSGFGRWMLIDSDHFLPHNLARHALSDGDIGLPKAEALAVAINQMISEDDPVAAAVVEDVLQGQAAAMAALASAEVVLDMSASVEVGRFLARECTGAARLLSAFLNPSGTDLVVLAEDQDRSIPLDCLEMQYYRAVIECDDLTDHFAPPAGETRYSRSCRDVTSTLPQYRVALHSALGSQLVREAIASPRALVAVCHHDTETGAVRPFRFEPAAVHRSEKDGWTILADDGFFERVAAMRERGLPSETGGVLLGAFDTQRRAVYIVSALPAPPDSVERPTYFARGSAGLKGLVASVRDRAGGMVEYVGEWHSHPEGGAPTPSTLDVGVLEWQARHMSADGLPAVMLIVGDSGHAWYVASAVGE
jgi:hypothetical protein